MYIFYNGEMLEKSSLKIDPDNRAFMYGDGVFETIIYQDDKLKYEQYHKERLLAAMRAMNFVFEDNLALGSVFSSIHLLAKKSNFTSAKVRLQVWRAYGGLYTPQSSRCHVMATCIPFESNNVSSKEKVSFSYTVKLSKTNWSAFKTLSSIPYIQAGMEKTQRKLDELILLDHDDHISEGTSSNIFWKRGDTYFTPSLETGCIDGIMRRHIIHQLDKSNFKLQIGEFTKNELLEADEVFSSNVTGVQSILSIDERQFSHNLSIKRLLEL